MKTITSTNQINSHSRNHVPLLAPLARAIDPPPGGAYPNQTTALNEDALFSDQLSFFPAATALGFHALYSGAYGSDNTAVGSNALVSLTDAEGSTKVVAATL